MLPCFAVPCHAVLCRVRAIAAMEDCFSGAFSSARGGFVRDTLVGVYPRLAGLLEGAAARVLRDTSARDVGAALDDEQAAALLGSAGEFQEAYLAAVLARLSEAAAAAFPGNSRALPTAADLQKSIARVHEELKAASGGWPGWHAAGFCSVVYCK